MKVYVCFEEDRYDNDIDVVKVTCSEVVAEAWKNEDKMYHFYTIQELEDVEGEIK